MILRSPLPSRRELVMSTILSFLASVLLACTSSQLATWDKEVAAGNAAVVSAEPLICATLDVTDPNNATALCQVVDQTGNVLATLTTLPQAIANIIALVNTHPAKTVQAQDALAAAITGRRALMPAKKASP